MGLVHLRKADQQQAQSGNLTHHDITTPTLSSINKQTKMYNNSLISNNNSLMSSITESKIPIVRDDGKSSSRLSHHLHHMTLRGRSKVRVRTSVTVEQATATRILRDNSSTPANNFQKRFDSNSNPITSGKSDEDLTKPGITLELNATSVITHPSGIPINNNNVKRGKRSLSSTRIEKEKCDEYNTKLLRKTMNGNNNNAASSINSPSSSAALGSTTTTMTKSSSLSRKLGSASIPNDMTSVTAATGNCTRNSKGSEPTLSLKLRKKISY